MGRGEGMAPVFQLIYVSTARGAMGEDTLAHLLAQSRWNNAQRNITGLLIYAGGNFIQALEGDERIVRDLYAKICRDARHDNVRRVLTNHAPCRDFPDWWMAYQHTTDVGQQTNGSIDAVRDRCKLEQLLASEQIVPRLLNTFCLANLG